MQVVKTLIILNILKRCYMYAVFLRRYTLFLKHNAMRDTLCNLQEFHHETSYTNN